MRQTLCSRCAVPVVQVSVHNGLQQLQLLLSAPADALVISSPLLTARVYAELDPHGTPKIGWMSDVPVELATEAVGGISVWNHASRFFAALTLATAHVANVTSDTTMLRSAGTLRDGSHRSAFSKSSAPTNSGLLCGMEHGCDQAAESRACTCRIVAHSDVGSSACCTHGRSLRRTASLVLRALRRQSGMVLQAERLRQAKAEVCPLRPHQPGPMQA